MISGIPYDAVPLIQEKTKKEHGNILSVEHRFMYAWTKPELPEIAMLVILSSLIIHSLKLVVRDKWFKRV